MRIVVITSCTGEKAASPADPLTLHDSAEGRSRLARREKELASYQRPAAALYTGQQHVRLMRGVQTFRNASATGPVRPKLQLWILSAGYGLVPEERFLVPYEVTFQGMDKSQLRRWADGLCVPADIRRNLRDRYDLGLLLLGDAYLEACAFDPTVRLGGPTIAFCGSRMARGLPQIADLKLVPLTNGDARRFSCGLVGLKGDLVH